MFSVVFGSVLQVSRFSLTAVTLQDIHAILAKLANIHLQIHFCTCWI